MGNKFIRISGNKGEKIMILRCNCIHEYQDKKYGLGNRVHNLSGNKPSASCTVCGSKKDIHNSLLKTKENKEV